MDSQIRPEEGTAVRGPDEEQTEARSGSALQRRLSDLEQQDTAGLRQEWRRLFRSDPPQLSRDLVLRALAYRLQEREHGGLSKATLRRIAAQARERHGKGALRPEPNVQVRPGARLVREWRGRSHTVTVTDDGLEYGGKTYASLTPIAETITGAHWSGPRFFGLVRLCTQRAVPPLVALSAEEARHG